MAATSGIDGSSVQFVGTDTAPISLGANGGATDLWTWTHNNGRRAVHLEVFEAGGRGPIAASSVAVGVACVGKAVRTTQPSVDVLTLQNQSTAPVAVILRVTWEEASAGTMSVLASTVGVLSGPVCEIFVPGSETNPFTGDVFIADDADVAAFAGAGYDAVLGNFEISATLALTSLTGLSTLEYVSGNVNMSGDYGSLPTLAGLENLKLIGANFDLAIGPNVDATGLNGLHEIVGTLTIPSAKLSNNLDGVFTCLALIGALTITRPGD